LKVTVAPSSGFCRGVSNAVDTAMRIDPHGTYILGELIHNPVVTEQIARRGIRTVDDIGEVPDGATLILRSHGAGKTVYEECNVRNIRIVDCTCPFVKRTQNIVREYSEEGRQIAVIGERKHPEVAGICGWCDGDAIVLDGEDDPQIRLLQGKNAVVVVQTTYSEQKFEKIIKNIKKVCGKTVEIFKTICYTTNKRQSEAAELSEKCDAMLVIGGLNSSNTNKL